MKYTELSGADFAAALASKAPVPGGGGTAALVGALAAALGEMVGNLTVGKKKYADVEGEITACLDELTVLREALLGYVEADAEAFEPLSRAYGIPKDAPGRSELMEQCLQTAAEPPMNILRACCRVIELQQVLAEKGSVLAISDAGCGAVLARAAMYAAALNVRVNTRLMTDKVKAESLNNEVESLMQSHGELAGRIYENVYGRLQ